jgi:hypothetical protein
MHKISGFMFGVLFVCALSVSAAHAAKPERIGVFGEWSAYTFTENGNKVCYMASQPGEHEGNYTKRGDIYALITHRPAEGSKNVFSYITGYDYKPASDVSVKIGSRTFTLFTQGEMAWTPDAETDDSLAKAIRAGSEMVVKGTSRRGTLTTDTYSLSGSSAAHDAITKACNL